MASKGKKGKKGKGKKAEIVDDIDPENMSAEQIMGHLNRIKECATIERKERNYLETEKNILLKIIEVLQKRLSDMELNYRNINAESIIAKERSTVEINLMKQKMKYLMFENQKKIEETTADNFMAIKASQDQGKDEYKEVLQELHNSRKKIKDIMVSHDHSIRSLKLQYADLMTATRADFERRMVETQDNYKNKLTMREAEMDLKFRNELHEVEERKNMEIQNLIQTHNKMYKEMKSYYNDITLNSVNLINGLKQECEAMRKKDDERELKMLEAAQSKKILTEKLDDQVRLNTAISGKLKRCNHIKDASKEKEFRLKTLDAKVSNLTKELTVVTELYNKAKQERDGMKKKFVDCILEVNQKASLKSCLLELKLNALNKTLQSATIRLDEVTKMANLNPEESEMLCKTIDEALNVKNETIRDLEFELERACKAHNDLIKTFVSRLKSFNVPPVETGFFPVRPVAVNEASLGLGPAGLVSKCVGLPR